MGIALSVVAVVVACENESQTPPDRATKEVATPTTQTTMGPTATTAPTLEPTPLTTAPSEVTADPAPGVVTGVEAGASAGSGEIETRWNAGSEPDLDHYNVYRSSSPGGPYEFASSVSNDQVGWEPDGIRSYIDLGRAGMNCYVVTAVDAAGNEGPTSVEFCGSPP